MKLVPTVHRDTLKTDLTAGFAAAVPAIPGAMAAGLLAGVGPLHGLYALMTGMPVAALTTGSEFMSVATTGAMSLATGGALAGFQGAARIEALAVLTVLTGLFQLTLGLLRLGTLIRFVSPAVMAGFLNGVAVSIVLGQLGHLTGYHSPLRNKVPQALDLLGHPRQVDLPTLAVGATAALLIVLLGRTRFDKYAMLVAVTVASLMVPLLGWRGVPLAGAEEKIPGVLPIPAVPGLDAAAGLLVPALAIGLLGLVQAAGISRSYPNPDGRYPDVSRDFAGQGLANIAAGLFRGQAVGGSLPATALAVNAGARSRWANYFTGLFAAAFVMLCGRAVERIPVAALAALLAVTGLRALQPARMRLVWKAGRVSRGAMTVTFVATLTLPVVQAVFLGAVLSLLLYAFRTAEEVRVAELARAGGGAREERAAPAVLPGGAVTILRPYGNLFSTGARGWEGQLPAVDEARCAVVLLILRGHDELGSTFLHVLTRYARQLQRNGGTLMLVGVSEEAYSQLVRTRAVDVLARRNVFKTRRRTGSALRQALAAADAWPALPDANDHWTRVQ